MIDLTFIIGYICTNYSGEITPDGEEVIEAEFFDITDLPKGTQPYIKMKLKELGPNLVQILRGAQY